MVRNISTASVVTSDKSDGELLAVTSSSNAIQHLILDTGCSFHMCANKEWFDTYAERSCEEVLMVDDSLCKIQGIGSVKIRMHDEIVREQNSLVPQQLKQQFQRSIALDKPKRELKKPERYGFDQDEVNYALNASQGDPTTYQEAIASDDQESWMVVMSE
ncbi:hypothetical protein LWI28_004029 [Acer negundo]|uniref:Retrovirus-related Pol polyprotein from transposon TNT 1-94-like beta-barrel domain-containing protein n=1 Tax=Acer negundo TaxID=4023 RepID=A0AAD5I5J0_ACENE|nr:hypothetical protein LWI28_004029 [Acer negundo]